MKKSVPLKLCGVSKSFGAVRALNPLNLDVEPGEMLALLGPSGCGKTTTLRIIAGFTAPDTGSVYIGGCDVTDLPPNKRDLGMVFQNYSLFPHMTVGENIAFGLEMRRVSAAERTARVRAMLELVRLEGYEGRMIHELSGGQQQRVALARSLVTNPSILLLDEPLGALDKNLRERMQFELREIQKRLGITSIIVTHDQEEALTMSDRIAVMTDGQIVQIGSPMEVYERPRTQFISEFLGTANIFEADVIAEESARKWIVRLEAVDRPLCILTSDRLPIGRRIKIAVRPERLTLTTPDSELKATVQDVVFRGSYFAIEVLMPCKKEPVYVYAASRDAISGDGVVGLKWPSDYAIPLKDGAAR